MAIVVQGSKSKPFDIDPDNRMDYGFDFSNSLENDTIISFSCTGQSIDVQSARVDGQRILFFVSNAQLNTIATVRCRIESGLGRIIDKTMYFKVREH